MPAVAAPPRPDVTARDGASAPSPDECTHPAPVSGIMAHEFSHYEGAIGPEGLRRTSTYYGPVIGGLPILAWHCTDCGLLRLSYPDGRREERRLYPGPQPGLLLEPTPFDPQQTFYGMQPRVSGLTAQPALYAELAAPYEPEPQPRRWEGIELPRWDVLTWMTVLGLGVVMVGLLLIGVLAVVDYSTPAAVGPAAAVTGYTFLGVLVAQVLGAVQRHWFPMPPLAPSAAVTHRAKPQIDGPTVAVVTLLVITMVGLLVAAILAVYTYQTSALEGPVVVLTTIIAAVATLIALGGFAARRLRR